MDTAKTTTDVRDTFEQLVRGGKEVEVQPVSRGDFTLAMDLSIRHDYVGRADLMDLQRHFAREVGRRLGEFAKSTCGVPSVFLRGMLQGFLGVFSPSEQAMMLSMTLPEFEKRRAESPDSF